MLPDCTREAAEARCAELQARMRDVSIDVWPDTKVQLKASAGVSVCPHDARDAETLISAADRRMYREKARRNPLSLARAATLIESLPLPGDTIH